MEGMMKRLFKEVMDMDIEAPFQRLSFHESMERFGNDKPDMRFGLELKDMADLVERARSRYSWMRFNQAEWSRP